MPEEQSLVVAGNNYLKLAQGNVAGAVLAHDKFKRVLSSITPDDLKKAAANNINSTRDLFMIMASLQEAHGLSRDVQNSVQRACGFLADLTIENKYRVVLHLNMQMVQDHNLTGSVPEYFKTMILIKEWSDKNPERKAEIYAEVYEEMRGSPYPLPKKK